jgi:uncharacterized protein
MAAASTTNESARSETMSAGPHPAASSPVIGPVRRQERIDSIDILRGVAILGILIVNMTMRGFSVPEGLPMRELWPNMVDRTVETLILFFADQQFITLFAFLFGLGLAGQMMRAEGRGARFLPLYLRRLCVLWLIGMAHFLLLWDGDILHAYAQDGFILLLFLRRSLKTLLVWAGILLCLPLLLFGFTTRHALTGQVNPYVMKWIQYEDLGEDQQTIEEARRIYSGGSYAEMIKFRASGLGELLPGSEDAYILVGFLLGLYAGRRGIFHDVSAHLPFIRRVQRWGLMIGVTGSTAFVVGGSFEPSPTSVMQNVGRMCLVFAAPAMSFFYASTIILLTQDEDWRRRLAPLAAVGRMALSNYLLQSLICSMIFYGYGLALFCKVRPSLCLLLTIIIWLIQIPLSVWWLRRFQFGPIEWLWRSLTYGQCPPMRVSKQKAAGGTQRATAG